jgi:hypothetical protein
MKITSDQFTEDDEDTWLLRAVPLLPGRAPVDVRVFSEEWPMSEDALASISGVLSSMAQYVPQAAELILENYSYEHFKKLGIPEEKLVDETPEAVGAAVSLDGVYFFDPEGDSFEMSFSAPWDPHHTFDIEFEDGKATGCSVNG